MVGVIVITDASGCEKSVRISKIYIGIQVIVAHETDVLDVVTYAVVGKRQPHVEPLERTEVEFDSSLNVGRYFGFAVEQHAVNGQSGLA